MEEKQAHDIDTRSDLQRGTFDRIASIYSSPTSKFLLPPIAIIVIVYLLIRFGGVHVAGVKYGDLYISMSIAGEVNDAGKIDKPISMIINFWTPSVKNTRKSYQDTAEYRTYKAECALARNNKNSCDSYGAEACNKINYMYDVTNDRFIAFETRLRQLPFVNGLSREISWGIGSSVLREGWRWRVTYIGDLNPDQQLKARTELVKLYKEHFKRDNFYIEVEFLTAHREREAKAPS